jgi:hypothetical protein
VHFSGANPLGENGRTGKCEIFICRDHPRTIAQR